MRKLLLTLIAFLFAATLSFAQSSAITANFDEDHTSFEYPILNPNGLEFGRIILTKGETEDKLGRTPITITLENSSNEYYFLLFERDWSKKALKREKPRIVFDKNYPGEKSIQAVQKVKGIDILQRIIIRYYGNNLCKLPQIFVEEGETFECQLPIYVAKYKKTLFCERIVLTRYLENRISITVEKAKDEEYDQLKMDCDSLVNAFVADFTNKVFCTNPLHHPSFKEQVKDYTQTIDDLRLKINTTLYNHKWPSESKEYERYEALKDQLGRIETDINLYEHDCGNDRTHTKAQQHSCVYCKLSLEEIYNKLDQYYIQLYVKETTKNAIIKDVEKLYRCCTDPSCSKHATEWKKGNKYKNKITDRYKQIKSFGQ